MEFITKVAAGDAIKADCVTVGVFADGEMTPSAKAIDAASKGVIKAAIKSGDVTGKKGSAVMLRQLANVAAPRVLVVGLGKREEFSQRAFGEAVRTAIKAAGPAVKDLAIAALEWTGGKGKAARHDALARLFVTTARETVFRTDELKSKKDDEPKGPASITLLAHAKDAQVEQGIKQGVALANGSELTKRLGNLPGNVCTPSFLGAQAEKLGKEFKLQVEVFDRKGIEKLGMDSFLSVTNGSAQPPRLIVMHYKGAAKTAAPVVLVGKGITFDTGGVSLKPGANMDEMKYDMCGAASVFGTLRAVAEMKLPVNVVGILVACENMLSGTATKPGDIFTSMSGQTIEVLNTDAEGRLILCDALTYAERFKPAAVIDIATLTGACVVALGDVHTGLFSPDDELADELLAASRAAFDPAWRMPVEDAYQDQLKSNFADMANIGAPGKAGAVVAACFLARFTKAYRWAHLDIAGTAWKSGAAKGATGRPVPLLTQFLMGRAGG
ncbi:MAG: leucyl aminopeptidase [Burkholderiales bacterium]|nr:leucyl aminopeptidase [Burkholderiales bacterium]